MSSEPTDFYVTTTVAGEPVRAFVPDPLPSRLKSQQLATLIEPLREAEAALARLDLAGELRRSQNWIGGSRPGNAVFVPPPPENVADLLGDLERYIHAEDDLAPLLRVALVHVQFETIHPDLNGNGRLGRMATFAFLWPGRRCCSYSSCLERCTQKEKPQCLVPHTNTCSSPLISPLRPRRWWSGRSS